MENFKEELSLYDEEKDQAEIGSAHRMIGEVCLQMNELKEAEKHIKKFLSKKIKYFFDLYVIIECDVIFFYRYIHQIKIQN